MSNRKPPWIRVRLPGGDEYARIKALKAKKSLHTVCENAMCPNIGECWGDGHATFLILGEICTRNCRFCGISTGSPCPPEPDEALRVVEAALQMGLDHVVITSVTRDDLKDGGAGIFASTIRKIREYGSKPTVEVLVPDFMGISSSLEEVLEAGPDILGHNVETIPAFYRRVRPGAIYDRSLRMIGDAKLKGGRLLTKSGIMVGFGESEGDLLDVMEDLKEAGCDILTIGQYLRPTSAHLPVERYYTPEEFLALRKAGLSMGFLMVESGPLVRTSYRASVQAKSLLTGGGT